MRDKKNTMRGGLNMFMLVMLMFFFGVFGLYMISFFVGMVGIGLGLELTEVDEKD